MRPCRSMARVGAADPPSPRTRSRTLRARSTPSTETCSWASLRSSRWHSSPRVPRVARARSTPASARPSAQRASARPGRRARRPRWRSTSPRARSMSERSSRPLAAAPGRDAAEPLIKARLAGLRLHRARPQRASPPPAARRRGPVRGWAPTPPRTRADSRAARSSSARAISLSGVAASRSARTAPSPTPDPPDRPGRAPATWPASATRRGRGPPRRSPLRGGRRTPAGHGAGVMPATYAHSAPPRSGLARTKVRSTDSPWETWPVRA